MIHYKKRKTCVYIHCRSIKVLFARMSSKETPRKVYSTVEFNIDPSTCRFCHGLGDVGHRKNIFKPLNQHLLKIAEQICGHPIVKESGLPYLVCRPLERRLKNTIEFQKLMLEAEQSFRERKTSQTWFKRCVDVSPSVHQPPKSRLSATRTAASSPRTCFVI